MKAAAVLGTRPEISWLSCEIERLDPLCHLRFVHTGRNFERSLSDVLFGEVDVRAPNRHFGVAGGSFAALVGAILSAAQRMLEEGARDFGPAPKYAVPHVRSTVVKLVLAQLPLATQASVPSVHALA